jgi:hypothetical protein
MRISTFILPFICAAFCFRATAQTNSPTLPQTERPAQTAAPSPDSPGMQTDRFSASREAADLRQAAYQELDKTNMAEIDRLLTTRKCQINRVAPLLDATAEAMNAWLTAERKYWELWNDAEERRVVDLRVTLASLEADAVRIANLIETENAGLQELQRQKAILEADNRTSEVVARLDGVIKDIRDTEARLGHAREEQDSVRVRIRELNASISARLVRIRENLAKLESWQLDQNAYYAERRATANDVCQAARPMERTAPASKAKKEH